MFKILASDPASQYCMTKKKIRMSWAEPGIKRNNFGRRRNIAICLAPADTGLSLPWASLAEGRNFLSNPIKPPAWVLATYLPIRDKCITCGADMMHTMASQWNLLCSSASRMGKKWSSMNNMVTITIFAWPMSSRHFSKADGLLRQSLAACILKRRPADAISFCETCSNAPDKWLSMVTSTTLVLLSKVRSTAEVSFGIVKRLHSDG